MTSIQGYGFMIAAMRDLQRFSGVRLHAAHVSALLSALLLGGCNAVLLSPAGDLAFQQRDLIIVSTVLMLLIIVPVIVLTLWFSWRYRASNHQAVYTPEWDHSTRLELLIWAAPLLIIIALGAITWVSTHKLDPYRPIAQLDAQRPVTPDMRPLTVEVIALDWKWLFVYPDQGIATVNELAASIDRPIRFRITASTVMNSFFIPALAGQIYAMPGMETQLHAVINKPGVYDGFSANYSGAGFSHMRFKFHGMNDEDFEQWVEKVKADGSALTRDGYRTLAQPSERAPVQHYATVDPTLYDAILNRCVGAGEICLKDMMSMQGHPHEIAGTASPASMRPATFGIQRTSLSRPLPDTLCTTDNLGRKLDGPTLLPGATVTK